MPSSPAGPRDNPVIAQYRRRRGSYDLRDEWVLRTVQERHAAFLRLLRRFSGRQLAELELLEIGCGEGNNLAFLLSAGLSPAHLSGIEVIPERAEAARERLPATVRIQHADASRDDEPGARYDVVLISLVFSSVLDDQTRAQLARYSLRRLNPKGGILWYDALFDNPRNPDFRAVTRPELKRLFPGCVIDGYSISVAPPISRSLCFGNGFLYPALATLPFLRSHFVAWISPRAGQGS